MKYPLRRHTSGFLPDEINSAQAYKWFLTAERFSGSSQSIASRVGQYKSHAEATLSDAEEAKARQMADEFEAKP